MEEKEMTFWAHLEDLRWSLVRVIAVLFVFVVVCFCLMPYLFDNFVLAPISRFTDGCRNWEAATRCSPISATTTSR